MKIINFKGKMKKKLWTCALDSEQVNMSIQSLVEITGDLAEVKGLANICLITENKSCFVC